jgi:hypothetical protein
LSFRAVHGRIGPAMNLSPLAQADLFDDADEDHGLSQRQA